MKTSEKPLPPLPIQKLDHCIGLDLSLTATGITILSKKKRIYSGVIKSKPDGKRPIDEFVRLQGIVKSIRHTIATYLEKDGKSPHLVVIENMAFGVRNATALTQLAGLNYLVREMCFQEKWRFILVAPMTLRKFITGSGKSDKNVMLLEIFKHYGESFFNDNEADSFGLAQIGLLFSPGASLSVSSKRIMDMIATQL